ncbi:alpha/beta hydrolase [Candidatus Bipolaricaulota bacterium]|nr:alpha/beta hydrolase [Candidatus Bipolaricaulota bacterium]
MSRSKVVTGRFRSGLPYNRFGQGPRVVIVFQGLLFENKPLSGFSAHFMARMYGFLEAGYSTYIVTRKPGLPEGYSMQDMAKDYAAMIREEFGGPVDVIGVSTGGSIAQHFAADHPRLVRRLVLHSSAFTLREEAKRAQMRVGQLARERRWRAAYAALMDLSLPRKGVMKHLIKPFIWLGSLFGGLFFGAPEDPADLVITIEAEDKHDFKDRLAQIKAPTLVVGGDKDPFYTEALFRKTAKGIPNARLVLYRGMGHPASGKQFGQDVMEFLNEKSLEHI